MRYAIACLILTFTLSVNAQINGQVIGVSDGDTVTVLIDRCQVKVRLIEIARQGFSVRCGVRVLYCPKRG